MITNWKFPIGNWTLYTRTFPGYTNALNRRNKRATSSLELYYAPDEVNSIPRGDGILKAFKIPYWHRHVAESILICLTPTFITSTLYYLAVCKYLNAVVCIHGISKKTSISLLYDATRRKSTCNPLFHPPPLGSCTVHFPPAVGRPQGALVTDVSLINLALSHHPQNSVTCKSDARQWLEEQTSIQRAFNTISSAWVVARSTKWSISRKSHLGVAGGRHGARSSFITATPDTGIRNNCHAIFGRTSISCFASNCRNFPSPGSGFLGGWGARRIDFVLENGELKT